MQSRNYVLRLPESGLVFSANRYFPESGGSEDGLTFVFHHSAAALKEIWEPTIAKLFQLATAPGSSFSVKEAWSLDWQNHGESAVLNEAALRKKDFFSMREVADEVRFFLESEYLVGHNVVSVAHSASTSAWVLGGNLSKYLPVKAAIFIEPTMDSLASPPSDKEVEQYLLKLQNTLIRRDTWNDVESLTAWLKKQFPWNRWDPRVLELYIKHGFREVTRAGKKVIVPKLTNIQEVGSYLFQDHITALDQCATFSARVPLHVVFSQRSELLFKKQRNSICDTSKGRNMASVTIMPGVGHWAVQEKPELVAETIFNIMGGSKPQARL
ncbi:hypothetical protein QCA50_016343 [Cerrena zonata]|uniref:AB hydrolase-1 domain-containing protein n=1 Tax=Cerrena zonata TaxID=2478898 RepID=A0AAW0FIJ5_9APHY